MATFQKHNGSTRLLVTVELGIQGKMEFTSLGESGHITIEILILEAERGAIQSL